jgi:hypothetical protein
MEAEYLMRVFSMVGCDYDAWEANFGKNLQVRPVLFCLPFGSIF